MGGSGTVVVCGAGAIGAAVAYYLCERDITPLVVDRCGVAAAASGKAGGFLAADWCDGTPTAALARLGFDLHADLAEHLGNVQEHRRLDTLLVAAGLESPAAGNPAVPWLDRGCVVHSRLGGPATTAQVHPEKLTRALLDAALARGARLRIGVVDGVDLDRHGTRVRGVRVDGARIDADAVVVAMGPWTGQAAHWLPLAPVAGIKSASMTVRPAAPVGAQALFVQYVDGRRGGSTPEVFPRPDGEVYVCGAPDDTPLPDDPAEVAPAPQARAALGRICADLSAVLDGGKVTRVQACYRPLTLDGVPMIGAVPGVAGAYVASGHGPWGILQSPATGLALAELIADGAAQCIDLAPFDPARFAQHLPERGQI